MIRRFARPYAKAFMEVEPNIDKAQKLYAELAQFEKARKSSPELNDLFGNPGIPLETKINIVGALSKRLQMSDIGVRMLDVLVRNQRINQLGSILEAWREMINKSLGVTVAQVRTAHELSTEERDKLRAALEKKTGRKVELELATDKSLLGGFVAQIGSEVLDASIVGQINRFQTANS